ncbi:Aldo/keto reductase [Dichomitus squalens LYAD-421 SS1]|uniref:Aldo/keto reductase n=1 Tax=Dichomitus squalens (strain LYAD-421) TaxID=732165 RepID=UPI0004412D91|nr:Aldo/keto reductase [Dichomitus squalens LYAD-421 SS1]EJF64600.1 Aldo/keto reductase [Dichomitus squalens LYAD-421 SS1]
MASSNMKCFQLNTGAFMPAVGLGCFMGPTQIGESEHVTAMVKLALDLGYRHFDTVNSTCNESSVGDALRGTTVPRSELFLTTKLDQKDHGRVREALHASLTKLGVDYVDLYLMHWPMAYDESGTSSHSGKTLQPDEKPTFVETWKDLEASLAEGTAKAIGVSNFSVKTLTELLNHTDIVPAVNQVELHPSLPQNELLAFCRERGILLTAYSPVGKFKFADDPEITAIADAHHASSAQLLLSWGVQRGTAVIPKTVHATRMRENLQLFNLTQADMEALDAFHKKPGMHRSVCGFHSAELGGSCWGWTYEQLGWQMTVGGVHL